MKRAALLAMATAVACAPAAWAGGKTNTTVTINSVFLAAGGTVWAGDLKSSRKACKNKRRVLIFLTRSGADEKVGSTKSFKGLTDNGYYWNYTEQGAAPSGKYYATVKPTETCKGDRSESIEGP